MDTPTLGILPVLPDDLSDPTKATVAAHCVHQIRTLLQIGPDSQGRRVFTLTSPSPQAGKTSLAISLGLSFAASGARTLLVDCDLGFGGLSHRMAMILKRRIGQVLLRENLLTPQQLDQALHLSGETGRRLGETLLDLGFVSAEDLEGALQMQEQLPVGLLDALTGEPLEECIADTGTENLYLLPIGSAEQADVAKLSPSAVRRMLDQARAQFDVVLIDSGSILGSLEAAQMSVESDGTVLIISRGEDARLVTQATEHLYAIGARVAGLVFNRAQGQDVQVVAERSTGSQLSRAPAPEDRGSGRKMGPLAGAVEHSRRLRRS